MYLYSFASLMRAYIESCYKWIKNIEHDIEVELYFFSKHKYINTCLWKQGFVFNLVAATTVQLVSFSPSLFHGPR